MSKMTITHAELEAARQIAEPIADSDGYIERMLQALSITIAESEPPEAMVKLARYTPGGNWVKSIEGMICRECGTQFVGRSETQTCCSRSCSRKNVRKAQAAQTHTKRACLHCGTEWMAAPRDNAKFCGRSCERQFHIARRTRNCTICNDSFVVKSTEMKGAYCKKAACKSAFLSSLSKGKPQPEDVVNRRAAAIRASRLANPEREARRIEAARAKIKEWHANPENAAKFAKRSSDRMKRLHSDDAEFQARRNERSSRVMRHNWTKYRDHFVQASVNRYFSGRGINTPEARAKKDAANKWILKQAAKALRNETDYIERFQAAVHRYREEMPYDYTEDYEVYCSRIGRLVTTSPECISLATEFLSAAIPRFAEEWQCRKVKS